MVRENNIYDIKLYEYAKEKLEHKIKKNKCIFEKVKKFKKENKIYGPTMYPFEKIEYIFYKFKRFRNFP